MAFIQWCYHIPILRDYIIHIPNGEYRHKKTARDLKLMGTRRGVSDFFFPYPSYTYHGLWIELKRQNGTQSSISVHQKYWLNQMKLLGYCAEVAYGCDDAIKICNIYISSLYAK